MNHLDLLLPFSLLKTEIASVVLRQCKVPALTKLLTCANVHTPKKNYNLFSRALPHEYWFASQLGLPLSTPIIFNSIDRGNSPPAAVAILRNFYPQNAIAGHWFIVQPVNFYITNNHFRLTAIDKLDLTEIESRRLYQSAQLLCAQYNYILLYVNTQIWLLRADNLAELRTSSLLAATGRNIEIWMPTGSAEKTWHKLHNEIQMQWFEDMLHINNNEGNQHKLPNSLWLWGGGNASVLTKNIVYHSNFNLDGWMKLATNNKKVTNITSVECILTDSTEHGLLMLDSLLEPSLSNSWGIWLERIVALDKYWFDPLLRALHNKQLDYLSIILSDEQNLLHVIVTNTLLRKFWMRSTLEKLVV